MPEQSSLCRNVLHLRRRWGITLPSLRTSFEVQWSPAPRAAPVAERRSRRPRGSEREERILKRGDCGTGKSKSAGTCKWAALRSRRLVNFFLRGLQIGAQEDREKVSVEQKLRLRLVLCTCPRPYTVGDVPVRCVSYFSDWIGMLLHLQLHCSSWANKHRPSKVNLLLLANALQLEGTGSVGTAAAANDDRDCMTRTVDVVLVFLFTDYWIHIRRVYSSRSRGRRSERRPEPAPCAARARFRDALSESGRGVATDGAEATARLHSNRRLQYGRQGSDSRAWNARSDRSLSRAHLIRLECKQSITGVERYTSTSAREFLLLHFPTAIIHDEWPLCCS